MIAIPAVDLREGACVQLVGGEYADERIRLEDPVGVAREWARLGFRRLHVIDLDAALSKGSNGEVIRDLLREQLAEVQVGGGLRSTGAVRDVLDDGARFAIVGTRALEDL
ncbi:MAG: 1-(5-phosphoribosyl)-5-((5-phosphoribosylamino)methylideneamino)imidazole-4-carboxamide isomerase, partial [Gemmatimonadaceae bacterium]|nr:1-(5-phosphoribosyl)-5-((5-phosphoribosylamino)methylideneamino)imidazole-4-carboxamide isomerase [Gemmatimonadaceae bacterium]